MNQGMLYVWLTVLNHHLSQRLKLIKMSEFNHLINILALLTYELKLPFN
jgi:hypothetical protein